MTVRHVIGWAIIAALFSAMIAASVWVVGWLPALVAWTLTFGVVGLLVLSFCLLDEPTQDTPDMRATNKGVAKS